MYIYVLTDIYKDYIKSFVHIENKYIQYINIKTHFHILYSKLAVFLF